MCLRERLPRISVPLLPKDEDVVLDIQSLSAQCYDRARYDRDIDYGKQPPVELESEDIAWGEELLRESGLRS